MEENKEQKTKKKAGIFSKKSLKSIFFSQESLENLKRKVNLKNTF